MWPLLDLCLITDEFVSSAKKRRVSLKKSKDKSVHKLYNKLVEVVSLLADLLSVEHLTDSTVLQLSSIGISSFFVEDVSQLQLSSLKLVVNVRSFFVYCTWFISKRYFFNKTTY